jgi:aconitate hydratase
MSVNSFNTEEVLEIGIHKYKIHAFDRLEPALQKKLKTLPVSLSILVENLLRFEDGKNIKKSDIEAIINWDPKATPDYEIQFTPGRVLLQDFTGVPVVADLTAMRSEIKRRGGDPLKINPLQPVDLVIDHSVQVDSFGQADSLKVNSELEFHRNHERYQLLKWAQKSFKSFRVVPPATGICHQVNLEHLSPLVSVREMPNAETGASDGAVWIFPDTVVGTDSHTPMINGLGVLGWGVGGIEAEAAMLGQPCSMLIPKVVGVRLTGRLGVGVTATDLVLTVTQTLRKKGVVGQFVEYFGSGISSLSLADRATISNMVPEYGATVGLFPVDHKTLDYMTMTGRIEEAHRAEIYLKKQNLFFQPELERRYSDIVEIDLHSVKSSVAGPAKPHDRWNLDDARRSWRTFLTTQIADEIAHVSKETKDRWLSDGGSSATNPSAIPSAPHPDLSSVNRPIPVQLENGPKVTLTHGSIVIAAITSCTNTSNPALMIGSALLARNANRKGLTTKPWVKTSFAPGSQVVTDYLQAAGLMEELNRLHFNLVGYGCTTCIGNSGPLPAAITHAIETDGLISASVLSGNRNFEARINPIVSGNYLMSPPLVVAYALVGHMDFDLTDEPIGHDKNGDSVFLKDIWPDPHEVESLMRKFVDQERFQRIYKNVSVGSEEWKKIEISEELIYPWRKESTYIQEPPFPALGPQDQDFAGARVLGFFGDFITTDHISPAGSFKESSPAGQYLKSLGVDKNDFNSYGSRRGNHEVMWRGTFANVRLQNKLTPEQSGGVTVFFPSQEIMTIFEASRRYIDKKTPLVILAGKEYGSGSSRDWAAKGPRLLGVRAIIAQSFERIHRSNLVGMGVAPLEFMAGDSAESLGLTGEELFSVKGLSTAKSRERVKVTAERAGGFKKEFETLLRIDTPNEMKYFRSGGVLPYVLKNLSGSAKA